MRGRSRAAGHGECRAAEEGRLMDDAARDVLVDGAAAAAEEAR
jgi:hypothetical protein